MNDANGQTGLLTEAATGNDLAAFSVGPLLALATIAERLTVSVDRLRGYADQAGVKEALGAVMNQGKGARYPFEAVDAFRALVAEAVPPKGALVFLRQRAQNEAAGAGTGETGVLPASTLARYAKVAPGETGLYAVHADAVIRAHDRLMTLREARGRFGLDRGRSGPEWDNGPFAPEGLTPGAHRVYN